MDNALQISTRVTIPLSEIELTPMRASGPGGQHVNKVSTAIHLRFDIKHSSLPDFYKQRLLASGDQRITRDGCIVIKSQQSRSQESNKLAALERLAELIRSVSRVRKKRVATAPSRAVKARRLDDKKRRSRDKALRKKITD